MKFLSNSKSVDLVEHLFRGYFQPNFALGALLALSFEHLLAWIYKIHQAYKKDTEHDYTRKDVED